MTSSAVNSNFTRNQLSTTYNFAKAFRFANSYVQGSFTNDTGAEVTLVVGTVLGRVSDNGQLKVLTFDASDGSQIPVGVCAEEVVVANNGVVADLNVVNAGDVREGALVFPAGTTLDSVISGRRLRDRIAGDTKGIRIVPVTENTIANNF